MKPGAFCVDLNNIYSMNNTNKKIDKLMSFYKPKKSTNHTNLNPNYFNQNKNINANINNGNNVIKNLNSNRTKGFDLTKNINPTRMKFSNGYSNKVNKAAKKNNIINNVNKIKEVNTFIDLSNPNLQQKIFINKQKSNLSSNTNNIRDNRSSTSASSVKSKFTKNYNNNNIHQKKRMGISQMNFYSPNMIEYFPSINNNIHKNDFNQNKINRNYNYDEYIYNMANSNININNNYYQNEGIDKFAHLFDIEYKRPEEKLRKGQNQLILEKLQQKYFNQTKNKGQIMHNTGTGFYPRNTSKNKVNNKARKISAQDYYNKQKEQINCENSNDQKKNIKRESESKSNDFKFSDENIEIKKNKKDTFNTARVDFNSNEYVQKNLEKRYSSLDNQMERKKRMKHFYRKLGKIFGRKLNYLWNDKTRYKPVNNNFAFNKDKKTNSYDYELKLFLNDSFEKKKFKLKRNITDNSLTENRQSKQYKIKYFVKKSNYANFIKTNKIFKNDNTDKEDFINSKSKEPKFQKIFGDEPNNKEKNIPENEKAENTYKDKVPSYKTTCNFFRQKQNKKNISENEENKGKSKDDTENKQHKFNIENIINNVIENNKKAAAARSSTSFYNIGRDFMNNRMRSTNSKFYSGHGGGYTGNKDTNFTKEQAESGQQFTKLNSLKITLLNPINWRKHEEIWGNLSSLNIGLIELEKYLMPPNDTDVLISSYLKMYPRVLNFCTLTKINSSNSKNQNNFISFMIDDNITNPKQEMKKWKEAYKRVILRWHPDKLYATLEEMKLMNEQQKVELKKKSTLIINNMNSLFKKIMEILKKVLLLKNNKED